MGTIIAWLVANWQTILTVIGLAGGAVGAWTAGASKAKEARKQTDAAVDVIAQMAVKTGQVEAADAQAFAKKRVADKRAAQKATEAMEKAQALARWREVWLMARKRIGKE